MDDKITYNKNFLFERLELFKATAYVERQKKNEFTIQFTIKGNKVVKKS